MSTFKNNIKTWAYIGMALVLTLIGACKKDEAVGALGGTNPTSDKVVFSATPTSDNANIIEFKNLSSGVIRQYWDLGNGITSESADVTGSYPLAGTYTVKLKIVTAGGGVAENTQTITITTTNTAMLSDEEYTFLSGGLGNPGGKTWVIDKTETGHLGVGPSTSQFPDWYQAGPNEKAAEGFYDDEMVFALSPTGLNYTYKNNGNTFANGSNSAGIGGPGGSDDITVNYVPPTNLTWSYSKSNGKRYITIGGNGFISYYLGVSTYEILTLTDDEMWLRCGDKSNAGNAWYLKLIRKGYVRPVTPATPKPLKPANLSDDFDVTSNFTWVAENMTYKRSYDNPFALPPNPSAKVGYYEKWTGEAGQYGNLQVTLPYRFDLTTKNKVKIKVYLPGGNDFPTINPTVSVKLQNSLLGGNSWTTQKEVKITIPSTQYNKWIELEFDFSAFAAETDYDKIVLQLGGEGHFIPGLFYIDDFEFK